jgi:ArsR family transcriptional regulator
MSVTALDVRSFSRLFKALGDETRLRIVALLSHGELCVCHLEKPEPGPAERVTTPRHPAHGCRRAPARGSWVYYRLAEDDAGCQQQLKTLMRASASGPCWARTSSGW